MTRAPSYFADWDVAQPATSPLPSLHSVKKRARRLHAQRKAAEQHVRLKTIYAALAHEAGYPDWVSYRAALTKKDNHARKPS